MAFVQKKDGSSASTSSLVITLNSLPTSGNTLFLLSADNNGGVQGVSGGGGTWTKRTSPGVNNALDVWQCPITGTPATAITVTYNAASRVAAKVEEWGGTFSSGATTSSTAGTSATISSASLTPSADNAVVFMLGVSFRDFTGGPSGSVTNEGNVTSASFTLGVASQVQSTAANVTTTWTLASSNTWDGCIISFIPDSPNATGTSAATFQWATAGVAAMSQPVTGVSAAAFQWTTSGNGSQGGFAASFFGWTTAGVGTVAGGGLARPFPAPVTTQTFTIAPGQFASSPTNISTPLNNYLATIPNGSIVNFPINADYTLNPGIMFGGARNNIILNGRGTILRVAVGALAQDQLASGIIIGHVFGGGWTTNTTDIQIHDFHLIGNSANPGIFAGGEQQSNLELGGGTRIECYNMTLEGAYGDGLFWEDVTDGWSHDNNIINAGRNGVSTIGRCTRILEEQNIYTTIGYCTFDVEPNDNTEFNVFITFRNNTWGTWGNCFFALDGSLKGAVFSDIVVDNNHGVGPSLLTVVTGPGRKQRITFTNNSSSASGTGTLTFNFVDVIHFKYNYQHGVHAVGIYNSCTGIDTAETNSGSSDVTFRWATSGVGGVGTAGVSATTFGWGSSGTGASSFSGTSAVTFGWGTTGIGLESITGAIASSFGWSTQGFGAGGAAGSVAGTSDVTFTWATSANGTVSGVGVFGNGGSVFGWATFGFGGMERRQDPRVLEMMFPGPKGVWFQPPRP